MTHKYFIAELKTAIATENAAVLRQAEKYRADFDGEADISINIPPELITKRMAQMHCTREKCEYLMISSLFYRRLLKFDGFMMQASVFGYKGMVCLFSGSCSMGESTRAELWRKYFGEGKTICINDDKPAIRKVEDRFYIYGTPFGGGEDLCANIKAPLTGIVYFSRAAEPGIRRVDEEYAVENLLRQTTYPYSQQEMDSLLDLFEELSQRVPIYEMGSNVSEESFCLLMETLTGKREDYGE